MNWGFIGVSGKMQLKAGRKRVVCVFDLPRIVDLSVLTASFRQDSLPSVRLEEFRCHVVGKIALKCKIFLFGVGKQCVSVMLVVEYRLGPGVLRGLGGSRRLEWLRMLRLCLSNYPEQEYFAHWLTFFDKDGSRSLL